MTDETDGSERSGAAAGETAAKSASWTDAQIDAAAIPIMAYMANSDISDVVGRQWLWARDFYPWALKEEHAHNMAITCNRCCADAARLLAIIVLEEAGAPPSAAAPEEG